MNNNICNFVPYHKDYHSIHTINFVYETNELKDTMLKMQSVYKMHIVCSGNGLLHTQGTVTPLKKGDIFFTFPAFPFCIESGKDFSFMYISFLGTRTTIVEDMLGISSKNFFFPDCDEILDFWKKGFAIDESLSDLISESILLYSFSFLGNRSLSKKNKAVGNSDAVSVAKKFIDDNLSDPDLSLDMISKKLNYNKKYISTAFKKQFKLGFSEYLNTIRIQYACTMIQQGYTSINDISRLCGYSDPHYFSNVFKKKMYISPKAYVNQIQSKQ